MSKNSNKLGRFGTIRQSAGLLAAIRVALIKIISPSINVNYSHMGEDSILKVFFSGQDTGFFVDVGCNHPTKMNNTYLLYQQGWRGINIDGNPALIAMYGGIRKRDINLTEIISDEEKTVTFHMSDNDQVSTIDEKNKEENAFTYVKSKQVQSHTLNTVLKQHLPKDTKIDLLCVDVEGHDLQVLKSIDLAFYKPKMIVVEMHNFSLRNAGSSELYNYIVQQGYHLEYFSVINGYFVRN
jgi:FkbM family methyltransferase